MEYAQILGFIILSITIFGIFYSTFAAIYQHYRSSKNKKCKNDEATKTNEMTITDWNSDTGLIELREVIVIDGITPQHSGVVETVTGLREV